MTWTVGDSIERNFRADGEREEINGHRLSRIMELDEMRWYSYDWVWLVR